ncbi:hypothetical protein BV898_18254 [Hypsibius exemplaris]|uniref:Uncharacterized protein n=1 Tax=Hypsibius exemplaris TaxID=2072580 RepID=A0A9X6NGW2_HYPEX|nr:hypothetical protein BV898_18254 [Hypsibius exemplaris]
MALGDWISHIQQENVLSRSNATAKERLLQEKKLQAEKLRKDCEALTEQNRVVRSQNEQTACLVKTLTEDLNMARVNLPRHEQHVDMILQRNRALEEEQHKKEKSMRQEFRSMEDRLHIQLNRYQALPKSQLLAETECERTRLQNLLKVLNMKADNAAKGLSRTESYDDEIPSFPPFRAAMAQTELNLRNPNDEHPVEIADVAMDEQEAIGMGVMDAADTSVKEIPSEQPEKVVVEMEEVVEEVDGASMAHETEPVVEIAPEQPLVTVAAYPLEDVRVAAPLVVVPETATLKNPDDVEQVPLIPPISKRVHTITVPVAVPESGPVAKKMAPLATPESPKSKPVTLQSFPKQVRPVLPYPAPVTPIVTKQFKAPLRPVAAPSPRMTTIVISPTPSRTVTPVLVPPSRAATPTATPPPRFVQPTAVTGMVPAPLPAVLAAPAFDLFSQPSSSMPPRSTSSFDLFNPPSSPSGPAGGDFSGFGGFSFGNSAEKAPSEASENSGDGDSMFGNFDGGAKAGGGAAKSFGGFNF